MSKRRFVWVLAILVCIAYCWAADNDPWNGTAWNIAGPDIDQPIGNAYKEIFDVRKGVAVRMNKEHETLATSSAGGVHEQGSARAFFQDAAPTTQVDTTAWDSGDTGSLWFDTNSTPDNLAYVLTDSASTGTWTLLSTSLTAEIVAAAHQWADVQTDDLEAIFTLGLTANGPITLGAGDDLLLSTTSDITISGNTFTVAGATGNTVVAGTLGVTGKATLGDTSVAITQSQGDDSTQIATTEYVDAGVAAEATLRSFGANTREDDDTNNMVKAHAYLANQDGFVTAFDTQVAGSEALNGYVGATDDPAGAGDLIATWENGSTSNIGTITFPVASGKYFEITWQGTGEPTIYWHPIGTLVKPTDQEP